ncbi:MAG: inositol monophosphatase family protein [Candidatus Paceibacterota bacterium]
MAVDYQKVLDFMKDSGHRLKERSGNVSDIGVTKTNVTDEDFAIERGFKAIILGFGSDHVLYAEEENDVFVDFENVWAADPISGTRCFIAGEPHYSITIAHIVSGKVVFSAVYDPSVDELYTAYVGKGAFLNGIAIKVSQGNTRIIFRPSSKWHDPEVIRRAETAVSLFELERNAYSMAVNYCWVAAGRFDGVVSFTKDSFPEFAGGFILQQAEGCFTNVHGDSNIASHDRIFIGGNKSTYDELFPVIVSATHQ